MLELFINQIVLGGWWRIVLFTVILYNIFQLLRQQHIIYFLGYFLFFVIYFGILLIYFDLDIFCFILLIVYGGLIIVIFIFSLMWNNLNKFSYDNVIYRSFFYGGTVFIFGFFFICNSLNLNLEQYFSFMLNLELVIYAENIRIDLEEELEVLGWGIGINQSFNFFLATVLLSLSCFVVINIINLNSKVKWIIAENSSNFVITKRYQLKGILLRVQNFFIQESSSLDLTNRIIKNFHHRRI